MTPDELRQRLDALTGREGDPRCARDPVNLPMIRHWCDAIGDLNPIYTDSDFAEKSVHGGLVAPPTMLQAWSMPGLRPPEAASAASEPVGETMRLLDAAGYTSVVATNCRQEYVRYLRPDDLLTLTTQVASVSEEKRTGLGIGRFVDEVMIYRDERGEEVARMTFRLLKFKPPKASAAAEAPPEGRAKKRRRPRPARNQDTAFFWEGIEQNALRVQRCSECSRLRHPPGPMCPHCQSLEWDTIDATGRGRVFSYVVVHHPPVPPFEYPNAIALIELEEGTRIVSNLVGIDPGDITIDLPVQVEFTRVDEELVLPVFRPVPRGG